MKLGDMTIRQIAEMCRGKICRQCLFYEPHSFGRCRITNYAPEEQNLNMEVKTDAMDGKEEKEDEI